MNLSIASDDRKRVVQPLGRRGQFIVFSAIFMLFIFFLIFSIFFDYLVDNPAMTNDEFVSLQQESTRLTNALMLPGYPRHWNLTTVQRIGLVDDGLLNLSKLDLLSQLTSDTAGYSRSKSLLSIRHDYLIAFSPWDAALSNITKPGSFSSIKDLVGADVGIITKQERVILYQTVNGSRPVTMLVYLYKD